MTTTNTEEAVMTAAADVAEAMQRLAPRVAALRGHLADVGRTAYERGGPAAAVDVAKYTGDNVVSRELASLLSGVGLGALLTQTVAVAPITPAEFVERWKARVASGQLRGRSRPKLDDRTLFQG